MGALPHSRLGPYRIDSRLGGGGMGEVYRAWDQRLERFVALKRLHPQGPADQRTRLLREARAAARVKHPGVVQIHDVVSAPEGDAIVMEWIEGRTLAELRDGRALPVDTALDLARQVAEALAAAHALGLVHRDLKAENVMLDADGRVKVLDFGLARPLPVPAVPGTDAGADTSSLASGAIVGTFRAMSPEQARGLPVDHRADLFALGVLLYELLSGRSPFAAQAPAETLMRVCLHTPEALASAAPGVAPELSELVASLIEKDPARRPKSAAEVAAQLRRLQGTRPDTQPPVEGWRTAGTMQGVPEAAAGGLRSRDRRRAVWLVAGLALAATLALALGHWRPVAPSLAVAVLRPVVLTSTADEAASEGARVAADGLRLASLRALLALDKVALVAPALVDAVSGSPVAVARGVGADELLAVTLDCRPGPCQATFARSQADGRLLWTHALDVPVDRPLAVAEAVQGALRTRLRRAPRSARACARSRLRPRITRSTCVCAGDSTRAARPRSPSSACRPSCRRCAPARRASWTCGSSRPRRSTCASASGAIRRTCAAPRSCCASSPSWRPEIRAFQPRCSRSRSRRATTPPRAPRSWPSRRCNPATRRCRWAGRGWRCAPRRWCPARYAPRYARPCSAGPRG